MCYKSIKQIKVVEACNGAEFQELYNKTAEELSECDVEVEIEHPSKGHCAYFMYTLHIQEPKTIKQALNEVGVHHYCCECPFLQMGSDARVKKWKCDQSPYGTARIDDEMCEFAYGLLVKGDLELIKDGEPDEEIKKNCKVGY